MPDALLQQISAGAAAGANFFGENIASEEPDCRRSAPQLRQAQQQQPGGGAAAADDRSGGRAGAPPAGRAGAIGQADRASRQSRRSSQRRWPLPLPLEPGGRRYERQSRARAGRLPRAGDFLTSLTAPLATIRRRYDCARRSSPRNRSRRRRHRQHFPAWGRHRPTENTDAAPVLPISFDAALGRRSPI